MPRGPPQGLGQFLKGQLFETPPLPTTDLAGRTYVVTGANSGLGLDCCKHLVRQGAAHIVMGCRNIEAAKATRESIKAAAGIERSPKVTVWPIDLANYHSVVAFADRCKELDRIDGLVANAGISTKKFSLAEGDERTITINVLSTFLLVLLMVPILRRSAQQYSILPHITVTGSAVSFFADDRTLTKVPEAQILATLSDPKKIDWADQYNLSKLLVLLCVQEVAEQLSQSSKNGKNPAIVINNVNPGFCSTNLFRSDDSAGLKLGLKMIGRTSEQGSRTLAHGVAAGEASHGKYMSECRVKPASSFASGKEGQRVQKDLWNEVIAKLEVVQPGIGAYTK